MITFRVGAFKTDTGHTGVALQSESSQRAIGKLNKLGLIALAIQPPPAKTLETSPTVTESPTPEKLESFYSDGLRMQRWKLWVSSLPLSFVFALGFYLFFTGTPQWIVGEVMLAGFFVFILAGFLIEQLRLRAFACPRCRAGIKDWDTNETHRILFNCARCGSRWDIEYKLWPGSPPPWAARRGKFPRSYFCTLCSPRGAH